VDLLKDKEVDYGKKKKKSMEYEQSVI